MGQDSQPALSFADEAGTGAHSIRKSARACIYRVAGFVTCKDGGMPNKLTLTGDAEADQLLSEEPLALLIGMLLDQPNNTH